MVIPQTHTPLARRKLAAFEQLQSEFESCFHFVQDIHGQQRFSTFPIRETVYYLYALWVCECKDRLLNIYKNIVRYEGSSCLNLLQGWQRGATDAVIAFLQRKLDGMPFADLTSQLQQARAAQQADAGLVQRLAHGRQVLLNRGMNLLHAFETMFALSEQELAREVREACAQYGHRPEQIEPQLAEMDTPLYVYVPHQLLGQRNMLVMNMLGMAVMTLPTDLPGECSWKVLALTQAGSFAKHAVAGYVELISPWHNNLKRHRFTDRPEHERVATLERE